MHKIGRGHECSACKDGLEHHYKRHKEITELLAVIQKIDTYGTTDTPKKVQIRLRGSEPAPEQQEAEYISDNEPDDVADDASLATGVRAVAERRKERRALKDEKSKAKALKNQERFDSGITAHDIAAVAQAIHGDTSDLELAAHNTEDLESIVQRNIGYVAGVHASKKIFHAGTLETLRPKDKQGLQESESIKVHIDTTLSKLGIAGFQSNGMANPSEAASLLTPLKQRADGKTRKERQTALNRVRVLIREDVEKCDAEEVNTLIRMAGYWRYVNKGIYNRMMAEHEDWEWATGEKVQQVDETEQNELGEEEEEEIEAGDGDEGAEADNADEPEDDNEAGALVEEEAEAEAEAEQAWDEEADAELNATFGNDKGPMAQLAYSRYILMPDNAAALQRITMMILEGLVLAVSERDIQRAEERATQIVAVNRFLAILGSNEAFLPKNQDQDFNVVFGNQLFDWIGATEDNVFGDLFSVDPEIEDAMSVRWRIRAAGEGVPYFIRPWLLN